MNKSKLAVGIMTAVLAAGTLAGCDNNVKSTSDGSIITYNDNTGKDDTVIDADKLLELYYQDSSKYQSIYDAIYNIVVRNYFTKDDVIEQVKTREDGSTFTVTTHLGKYQLGTEEDPGEIRIEAAREVEKAKDDAKKAADNNNSSYKKEFDAILASKGAKDEKELKEKYIEEIEKTKFDENFYKYHIDDIKLGDKTMVYTPDGSSKEKQVWNGYFKDRVPYHVSHILVNVSDDSETNYSSGTISEDDAKTLFDVVDLLGQGKQSFESIASTYQEFGDKTSAEEFGNLGIMDYETGYVDEFRLGIYAYENFFGEKKDTADFYTSKISLYDYDEDELNPTENQIAKDLKSVVKDSFGTEIPTIDFSVFEELKSLAETDKDENGKAVLDDAATFYPRNIVYNKFLNRHSFAFITNASGTEGKYSGFHEFDGIGKVLAVKTYADPNDSSKDEWTPVLCVRAGGSYHGIHFILVNRSPFVGETVGEEEKVVRGVSLNNYYTTYYDKQDDYPRDSSGKQLDTYINFSTPDISDQQSKADNLYSTLKSYDSERLNKYVFQKYFEFEKLHLSNEELQKVLFDWIYRGFEKKEEEAKDAWETKWNNYIDVLRKQNSERKKLVSEACKIAFLKFSSKAAADKTKDATISAEDYTKMVEILTNEGMSTDDIKEKLGGDGTTPDSVMTYAKLFKEEGGLCNDGKPHF